MKYKKNDILVNRDGYKRKVLAVVDNLCALSGINKYTVCRDWYTQEVLDAHGYTLDSSEWEPERNEFYWYSDLNMQKTSQDTWNNHNIDIKRKQLNLAFPTRELAEKRLAEVITLLKK